MTYLRSHRKLVAEGEIGTSDWGSSRCRPSLLLMRQWRMRAGDLMSVVHNHGAADLLLTKCS